jgi:Rho-binding antiterminator
MINPDLPPEYQPIACSLHDQLEAIATLRREVVIWYEADDGGSVEVTDRIADLYSRGGAEFLRLASGDEIRLDRIESVAGISYRQR